MKRKLELKDRLVLGLDVPIAQVASLLMALGPLVGWAKVNRAFIGGGITLLNIIQEQTKTFLDLKWSDIPETVRGYVEEVLAQANLNMFNAHALGGYDMLHTVASYLDEKFKDNPEERPLFIAVTILTSIVTKDLERMGIKNITADELTVYLAILAKEAGCDGIVAAATELERVRSAVGDDFLIVTPAIRFVDQSIPEDDQKRMATPDIAIQTGADILVMARPLIQGGKDAVEKAFELIQKGLDKRGQ